MPTSLHPRPRHAALIAVLLVVVALGIFLATRAGTGNGEVPQPAVVPAPPQSAPRAVDESSLAGDGLAHELAESIDLGAAEREPLLSDVNGVGFELSLVDTAGAPIRDGPALVEFWTGASLFDATTVQTVEIVDGWARLESPSNTRLMTLKRVDVDGVRHVPTTVLDSLGDGRATVHLEPLTGVAFVACDELGHPRPMVSAVAAGVGPHARSNDLFARGSPIVVLPGRPSDAAVRLIGDHVGIIDFFPLPDRHSAVVVVDDATTHTVPVRPAALGLEPVVGQRCVTWDIALVDTESSVATTFGVRVEALDGSSSLTFVLDETYGSVSLLGALPVPSRVIVQGLQDDEGKSPSRQVFEERTVDLASGLGHYSTEISVAVSRPTVTLRVEVTPSRAGYHDALRDEDTGLLNSQVARLIPLDSAFAAIRTQLGTWQRLYAEADERFVGQFTGLSTGKYQLTIDSFRLAVLVDVIDVDTTVALELGAPCELTVDVRDATTGEPFLALVSCSVASNPQLVSRRLEAMSIEFVHDGKATFATYQGTAFLRTFAEGYSMTSIERELTEARETVVVHAPPCPKFHVRIPIADPTVELKQEDVELDAFFVGGLHAGTFCVLRPRAFTVSDSVIEIQLDTDLEGTVELDCSIRKIGYTRTYRNVEALRGTIAVLE